MSLAKHPRPSRPRPLAPFVRLPECMFEQVLACCDPVACARLAETHPVFGTQIERFVRKRLPPRTVLALRMSWPRILGWHDCMASCALDDTLADPIEVAVNACGRGRFDRVAALVARAHAAHTPAARRLVCATVNRLQFGDRGAHGRSVYDEVVAQGLLDRLLAWQAGLGDGPDDDLFGIVWQAMSTVVVHVRSDAIPDPCLNGLRDALIVADRCGWRRSGCAVIPILRMLCSPCIGQRLSVVRAIAQAGDDRPASRCATVLMGSHAAVAALRGMVAALRGALASDPGDALALLRNIARGSREHFDAVLDIAGQYCLEACTLECAADESWDAMCALLCTFASRSREVARAVLHCESMVNQLVVDLDASPETQTRAARLLATALRVAQCGWTDAVHQAVAFTTYAAHDLDLVSALLDTAPDDRERERFTRTDLYDSHLTQLLARPYHTSHSVRCLALLVTSPGAVRNMVAARVPQLLIEMISEGDGPTPHNNYPIDHRKRNAVAADVLRRMFQVADDATRVVLAADGVDAAGPVAALGDASSAGPIFDI